jgi:hypothetical protein
MELVFLMVLFFVVSLIQKAAQKNKAKPPESARRRVPPGSPSLPAERPQSVRDLFAEVRRQMEEAQRQAAGEEEGPLLEADAIEEIEERESLEIAPVVRSLEVEPVRPERVLVDHDDEMDAVIRRRIKWAEDHARGRKADEHRAFDARIRRPKPKPKVVRSRAPELRRMVVWQTILNRPVALRDETSPFDPPS